MRRLVWAWLLVGGLVLCVGGCAGTDSPVVEQSGEEDAGTVEDGSDCVDQCEEGSRTCGANDEVLECVVVDGCAEFQVALQCPDYKLCEAGSCVEEDSECSNLCTPGSQNRCDSDGQVTRCDDHDGDGCFEWGGAASCPSGQACEAATGACEDIECGEECEEGQTRCEGDLVRVCKTDERGCRVFRAASECPSGQVCDGGGCQDRASCEDECGQGEAVCAADGGVRTCADHDGDGCLEFDDSQACGSTEECRAGSCVDADTCSDRCIAGEEVCVGNQMTDCADHDGDGCTEFANPYDCSSGETCTMADGAASCEPAPGSGTVVINEIFYDAVGSDVRGSGSSASSPTFVELAGTPGMDLSGFGVELVNGSNGQTYNTFALPAGATLDGNGFAVLAMDIADSYLSNEAPSYTNVYYVLTGYNSGADALQNGQDSIVLSDAAGTRVDAVGYGDFSATPQHFEGEGSSVAAPISGRSLGRIPGASDTDDNAADFVSFYPTPGLPNSDLVINEVYPNQPGFDDSTETFVELVAPIVGWEDMPLDGYVLHAINGFDGDDYLFSSNGAAGIEMTGYSLNDADSADGYVVICNIAANISLLNLCTVPYDGADFQNGPDNFVLRYDGRQVDAIGYGTFGTAETFVGEGTPISYNQSDAGYSLGRWPITDSSQELDTDDNLDDFWWLSPTPGATNPRP